MPDVTDSFIEKLSLEVETRISNPELDVEMLADSMSMSRRTLNRKLAAKLKTSANEFIRKQRLQKAASMLFTDYTISQTAFTVGFESPSYFTKCFKEEYGLTPSNYIAQNK
jgi:transcriptional regulator GlxA family with amidase domain